MASGTDPFPASDVARVRDVLIRELETITRYEVLASQAESPDVKNFLLHLAMEEKEHVAEAVQLMQQLDTSLEPHFRKPLDLAHFNAGASRGPPPAPPAAAAVSLEDIRVPADIRKVPHAMPAPPHPSGIQFSVGPLKRRSL
jgi:hypothetical protein